MIPSSISIANNLIVGTGVIGCIYGWALSEAGIDVTHLVRRGKASTGGNGVTLDLPDERKGHERKYLAAYPLKCIEKVSRSDDYELIILPTNSYQTEEALQSLLPDSGRAI